MEWVFEAARFLCRASFGVGCGPGVRCVECGPTVHVLKAEALMHAFEPKHAGAWLQNASTRDDRQRLAPYM